MSKFLEKTLHIQKRPQGVNLVAIGADNRIRTYDLLITNEPLYQLSYTSMCIVTSYSYCSKMSNTPILRLLQIQVHL